MFTTNQQLNNDVETKIKALKEQFNNSNTNFMKNVGNIFDELILIKMNYIEKNLEVDRVLDELNKEKEEIKKKTLELEEFRKVSFITSMNKRVEDRDHQISVIQKKYNLLEKKYKKLLEKNKIASIDIISDLAKSPADKVNDSLCDEIDNNSNIVHDNENVVCSAHSEDVDNDVNSIDNEHIDNENVDNGDFEEFEAELEDGKTYLFVKDIDGQGIYHKKLKSGKFSKKISGKWREDNEGELIIE